MDHGISILYFLLTSKLVFSLIFWGASSLDFVPILSVTFTVHYQLSHFWPKSWDCTMHGFPSEMRNCLLFLYLHHFPIIGLLLIIIMIILNINGDDIAEHILESFSLCWFLRVSIWCIVLWLRLSCYLKGSVA